MQIYSFTNRCPDKPEIFSTETKTESKGYIPVKKRIENLLLAGHQLQGFRDGMYDGHEEIDPFRRPGLDFADIVELSREAGRKVAEWQKRKQEEKIALLEASRASDEGGGKGVTPPN